MDNRGVAVGIENAIKDTIYKASEYSSAVTGFRDVCHHFGFELQNLNGWWHLYRRADFNTGMVTAEHRLAETLSLGDMMLRLVDILKQDGESD